MLIEIIVYDGEYPNGNSWKYGFSSVDEAVNFLKSHKEHLQTLGGLTPLAVDVANAFCKCVNPQWEIREECGICGKPLTQTVRQKC